MELKTAIEILEYHQKWRLGEREDMIHEPKKLTEALDLVIKEIKNIEIKMNNYGYIPYESLSDDFKKTIEQIEDNLNK